MKHSSIFNYINLLTNRKDKRIVFCTEKKLLSKIYFYYKIFFIYNLVNFCGAEIFFIIWYRLKNHTFSEIMDLNEEKETIKILLSSSDGNNVHP